MSRFGTPTHRGAYDFHIEKVGDLIQAVNYKGRMKYHDTDFTTVFHDVRDDATAPKKIFVAKGIFPIDSTVTQTEGVEVECAGIDKTIFRATGDLNPVWRLHGSDAKLKGCTVDGMKLARYIVDIYRAASGDDEIYNNVLDAVKIRGVLSTGRAWLLCSWDRESAWKLHDIFIKNCIIEDYSPYNTIQDNGAFSYCEGVHVTNTVFRNLGRCVNFYKSKNGFFTDVHFKNIQNYAALVIQASGFIGKGITCEDGLGVDVHYSAHPTFVTEDIILDLFCRNTSGTAFRVRDSTTYKIRNIKAKVIVDGTTASGGILMGGGGYAGVEDVTLDVLIKNCQTSGVYIAGSAKYAKVTGHIFNNNQSKGSHYAFYNQGENTILDKLHIYDDQDTATQTLGIRNFGGNILLWEGGLISATTKVNNTATITRIRDVSGYKTDASGTSTGTGAQQSIAHGLAVTPNRVMLCNIDDGANPYQSAVPTSTLIRITAVSDKEYTWRAWLE